MRVLTYFVFLTMLFSLKGIAQEKSSGILFRFRQDTVKIKAGETFSNALYIENKEREMVTLTQADYSLAKNNGLLRLPDTIRLKGGEKKWFPLKYVANRETIAGNLQRLEVQFRDLRRQTILPVAGFYAQLEDVQGLFIDTDQQEVYLNQITNEARVMVRLLNNGLIPLTFRMELTEIPDGLDFIGELTNIVLQPGAQMMLPYIAKGNKNSKLPADFAVTIRAMDQAGAELAVKRLRIMSVSSDRRLALNQTPFYQNKPNTVALRFMSVDNKLFSYQLQGNGKFLFEDDQQLSYQLNADYFDNPGRGGLNLSDSYVHYNNKKWGLKAGNIYESMDFNLNGRGLKGTVYLNPKRTVNAYFLDNNNMLYSNFNNLRMGNTFALSFKEEEGAKDFKNVILLRNKNLLTGINSSLASSSLMFPLGNYQNIGFEAGLSIQEINSSKKDYNGAALGLNYAFNRDNVNFSSYNYYSSPYYGGQRRGVFQTDNNASIVIDKGAVINARINLVSNQPKFFFSTNGLNLTQTNRYGQSAYELGYTRRIGRFSISAIPYYFYQYLDVNENGSMEASSERWKSSSLRTKLNTRFNYKGHEFSFESDNGYTFKNTSQQPPAPFWSSRMNFNYRNQFVGFTAFSQFNSYYLTDALGISQNPEYSIYSLGPNTNFSLLHRRLTVNANALYNYYGFSRTENYSFNGTLRWLLKGQWAISGDFYYGLNQRSAVKPYNPIVGIEQQEQILPQMEAFRFDNTQIRIGIEKGFGRTAGSDTKKLEMSYFEDRNGNGLRDQNEPSVSGLLVKIEGLAAITNAKGIVSFEGTKDKKYQVSIINNNGWMLLHPLELLLNKDKKLEVPLVQKERLSGILKYSAEKYKNEKPRLGGIRVKAIADNGIVFNSITDDKGAFNFYLPENRYTVYVETEGMPFSIRDGKKVVDVKLHSKSNIVFDYLDEQRKVEIMKF